MTGARVLFVDDEEHLRLAVKRGWSWRTSRLECHSSAEGIAEDLSRDFYGVVVTDTKMPGTDGITLMQRVLEIDPALPWCWLPGMATCRWRSRRCVPVRTISSKNRSTPAT